MLGGLIAGALGGGAAAASSIADRVLKEADEAKKRAEQMGLITLQRQWNMEDKAADREFQTKQADTKFERDLGVATLTDQLGRERALMTANLEEAVRRGRPSEEIEKLKLSAIDAITNPQSSEADRKWGAQVMSLFKSEKGDELIKTGQTEDLATGQTSFQYTPKSKLLQAGGTPPPGGAPGQQSMRPAPWESDRARARAMIEDKEKTPERSPQSSIQKLSPKEMQAALSSGGQGDLQGLYAAMRSAGMIRPAQ